MRADALSTTVCSSGGGFHGGAGLVVVSMAVLVAVFTLFRRGSWWVVVS
jgi:hypothetical protein